MTLDRVTWARAVFGTALASVAVLGYTTGAHTNVIRRSPADSTLVALGRRIFFDSTLSASRRMSCATCHDPEHAYAAPNRLAVQLGGPALNAQGTRAVPSLRYTLNRTPIWYKEYIANEAERIREGNEPPAGGFGDDGRFNSLHDQAAFPLLAANEMANASPSAVVAAIQRASYADDFRRAFGATVFADSLRAFALALHALQRFELADSSFHPYDSKFDFYVDGKVELTAQERRGLVLFDDPTRGNCSSCHRDARGADGSHPLFTDYQFESLGVPRNPEIAANRDSGYFDEGVCGPLRTDQVTQRAYCGMFKTPTLRNVATRGAFFHNGRYHSLRDALRFYVQRDTHPWKWYPRARDGRVIKFDDLPPSVRANVDTSTLPLARHAGERAVWTGAEIDDVIAFLETLSDGYRPRSRR